MALKAAAEGNRRVVCGFATGCMEVVSTIYPFTAWRCSYIHNAFENVAATVSGVEAAYRALKARGKLKEDYVFLAFGGDGGTYDIGLQSLSGALERGHKMMYVCYDNEGYMNTGIQRSGATPRGAETSTTPVGSVQPGKREQGKDLTAIVLAHNIPYVAQASTHNVLDMTRKFARGLEVDGPAFVNVLAPCHRGWRCEVAQAIEVGRVAVESCFWPLFEVDQGVWKLNYKPKEKKPITEWLKLQGRFKHLFKDENKAVLEALQGDVDRRWEMIQARVEESKAKAAKAGAPAAAPAAPKAE
jgi:pyruvate ferredoxin oxidoreductase beta subunit